jgi:hypothetical protein
MPTTFVYPAEPGSISCIPTEAFPKDSLEFIHDSSPSGYVDERIFQNWLIYFIIRASERRDTKAAEKRAAAKKRAAKLLQMANLSSEATVVAPVTESVKEANTNERLEGSRPVVPSGQANLSSEASVAAPVVDTPVEAAPVVEAPVTEAPIEEPVEHILLLLDGHGSRLNVSTLLTAVSQKVHILCLPSHLTHILQPNDATLNRTFKDLLQSYIVEFFELDHMITMADLSWMCVTALQSNL